MKCTNRSNDNNNKIYTINDTFVLLGIQILIELHICDTVRIQSCFCLFYGRVIRKMGRFFTWIWINKLFENRQKYKDFIKKKL